MNTYAKYCPNVYVAKCTEMHEKGETIEVTTKSGNIHKCIVFNKVLTIGDVHYYSIVRADGFDYRQWAMRRAERYAGYAANAGKKSDEYYEKSNKDRDFLSLGEPIKVGHHSEKRHRKAIEQANNNMGKSIEMIEKAEQYESRAEYWEAKASTINLSMPDSLEYFSMKLEEAIERHEGLKSGKYEKEHSFSLAYAKKEVNELKKKVEISKKLWE